ncbi:MAG TPA: hypothetical protein VGO02_12835 [Burkholderiales bacterium]|nr:hypothetical protein [Burkholderiales bacterium]
MTVAARNQRNEAKAPPSEKVEAISAGPAQIISFIPYVKMLARLSDIQRVSESELNKIDAPMAVIGNTKLKLKIEVDLGAERERVAKEIARIEAQIAQTEGKLSNETFVQRAPPKVVEEFRARLAEFRSTIGKLKEQQEKLTARA